VYFPYFVCSVMRSNVYMYKLEQRSYSANSNIHVYVYVIYIVCMNCIFFLWMHELCVSDMLFA